MPEKGRGQLVPRDRHPNLQSWGRALPTLSSRFFEYGLALRLHSPVPSCGMSTRRSA